MRRRLFWSLLAALTAWAADPRPNKPAPKPPPNRILRVAAQTTELEPYLDRADLQVSLHRGEGARVREVRTPSDDLLLLLVADLTGDLTRVDAARAALSGIVQSLPPNLWIGLLRAQDGLRVAVDPTADRARLAEALNSLPVAGKSALLDSVKQVVHLADGIATKTAARVAILYLTDSDVRNYREDFSNPVINSSDSRDLSRRFPEGLVRERIGRLTETVISYQTPVFIAHLSYSSERLNEAYQTGLARLASATGGAALFSRSLAEVPDIVGRVFAAAQNHYQIVVQVPARAPRDVKLQLAAPGRQIDHRTRFLLR